MDFINLLKKQVDWSKKTFGPNYNDGAGVLDHIEQEIEEVRAEPLDLEEWIDICILAFDGAWRCARASNQTLNTEELVATVVSMYKFKTDKNIKRNWPDWRTMEPGKAINHSQNDS